MVNVYVWITDCNNNTERFTMKADLDECIEAQVLSFFSLEWGKNISDFKWATHSQMNNGT